MIYIVWLLSWLEVYSKFCGLEMRLEGFKLDFVLLAFFIEWMCSFYGEPTVKFGTTFSALSWFISL